MLLLRRSRGLFVFAYSSIVSYQVRAPVFSDSHYRVMSSFLSWVAGAGTPNNSGRSIDLFLTQLESMPKLLDKRQSASDLFVPGSYAFSQNRMLSRRLLIPFLPP